MDRLPNFLGAGIHLWARCAHMELLYKGRKLKGVSKDLKNLRNANNWMNGKAYQNMCWKLLEKPDILRVLPLRRSLLNHWGRGSTLEMSSLSNLFNAYNVFWWTLLFIRWNVPMPHNLMLCGTIIYFNKGLIEWVWDSFIDGPLSPRTHWPKFVDGLITEFFNSNSHTCTWNFAEIHKILVFCTVFP